MSVIATHIGEELIIKPDPLIGVTGLTSFTDTITGQTPDRFFTKEFRLARKEGVFFDNWQPLTDPNLAAYVFTAPTIVWIELRYTRAGTDPSGILAFDSISFAGTFTPMPSGNWPVTSSGPFKDIYLYDTRVLRYAQTYFSSLYYKGFIPAYITRGETDTPATDDAGFSAIFYPIAYFYAIVTVYANQLQSFDQTIEDISSWLKQLGFAFTDGQTSLSDFQFVASQMYDQFRKRGTGAIFEKENLPDTPINGEFLRLIGWLPNDEFIWALLFREQTGWVMNEISPLYYGIEKLNQLSKSYQKTDAITNIALYPVFGTVAAPVLFGGKECMQVDTPAAFASSGIAYNGDNDFFIVVDPNLDYEISFEVALTDIVNTRLSFGIDGFDVNGNPQSPVRITSGSALTNQTTTLPQANTFYNVSFILFNKDKALINGTTPEDFRASLTSLRGTTVNYRTMADIKYIVPIVLMERFTPAPSSGQMYIHNLKITPLVCGRTIETSFTRNFLNANNMIVAYCIKNNIQYSDKQTNDFVRKYLIPYNSTCEIINLNT